MKSFVQATIFAIVAIPSQVHAQKQSTLNIDSCFSWAKQNYPLIRQADLIQKSTVYSVENASKGLLPQITVNGSATYQSDVTSFPISIPNVKVPTISKDQYKLYAELNQPLTDVYAIRRQEALVKANAAVEQQKLETELYKIKERITQLYFAVLLLNEQETQQQLLLKDIKASLEKMKVAVSNGTASQMNQYLLEAEFVKAKQRLTEIQSGKKGYLQMLATFISKDLDETTLFETPTLLVENTNNNRPELKQYSAQKAAIAASGKLTDTKLIPRVFLFAQGGYGRPALNMLNNEFKLYGIGGVKVGWNLSAFYTRKNDKQLIELSKMQVEAQEQTFQLNTNISVAQQNTEYDKINELLKDDASLVILRSQVKQSANVQLEAGTISALDLVNYINAEDQAKQALLLHKIQLLQAAYTKQLTLGNL
ncbi:MULTISPECIES: TolC family protein [unclassified Paraflavitalea]|uniref:TolC family protein n=1 Tax=unclassified Paraflavitalea TaxID=2798305 RepID=UPI003D339100